MSPVGFRVHWVYSGALCGSSGTLGVVGYIRVRHGDRRDNLGAVAFIRVHPVCRRVHSVSLGSSRWVLEDIGFIMGRWVNLVRPGVNSGWLD